jgi:hypothetical protein
MGRFPADSRVDSLVSPTYITVTNLKEVKIAQLKTSALNQRHSTSKN